MKTLHCLLLFTLFVPQNAQAGWPQFRGPLGQGHALAKLLPLSWNEQENVRWKVNVPGQGWSSPVIVDDRLWLTTATEGGKSLRALMFDASDGRLLRSIELFKLKKTDPRHSKNSFATPTPVIHKGRVFVHFGSRGTACLSMQGKVIWKHSRLQFYQPYASASSPIVFGKMLILTCDGSDAQFIAALHQETGDVIWKTARKHLERALQRNKNATKSRAGYYTMGYSTPLVIQVNGKHQLVSPAADHVAAYDVASGKELWWYPFDGFSLVARPVYGHGLVYVVGVVEQGRHILYAFRPTARGEVTKKDIAWQLGKTIPHVPSPLLIGDQLYLMFDGGVLSSVAAKTGKRLWQKRIGGNYSASPMYADGRILLVSESGKSTLVAPGKKFKPLATNQLKGRFLASPAAAGKAIYLRSDRHLYRIQR